MISVKKGKADFIHDHRIRQRDHSNGILPGGRDTKLNSAYSMGEWRVIPKMLAGVSGWKLLTGNTLWGGGSASVNLLRFSLKTGQDETFPRRDGGGGVT